MVPAAGHEVPQVANRQREIAGDGRVLVVAVVRVKQVELKVLRGAMANFLAYTVADAGAFNAPSVMASAWQASDGRVGVLLTNITEASIRFTVPLNPAALELEPSVRAYRLTEVIDGRVGPSVTVTVPSSVDVDLRPLEIRLLVLDRE
jgi:hypothetical protein